MVAMSTINEVMERRLIESDSGQGFYNHKSNSYDFLTYKELVHKYYLAGNHLSEKGVKKGDFCLITGRNILEQIVAFYGAISIGSIPLFLPSMKTLSGYEVISSKLNQINEILSGDFYLLSEDENLIISKWESIAGETIRKIDLYPIANDEQGIEEGISAPIHKSDPSDIAYLQMTSASTGYSKIVAVSHKNVLSNVTSMKESLNSTTERIVSWLPLYHDMGLVGGQLFGFCHGYLTLLMTPYNFLKRPMRWLETIDYYKCTLSPSPNFGYDYCNDVVPNNLRDKYDLSSWRAALNGAEPVRYKTMKEFALNFKSSNFKCKSFLPSYGLAESTLATTFSSYNDLPQYVVIKKNSIVMDNKIDIVAEGLLQCSHDLQWNINDEMIVFSVGRAIKGIEVQIFDSHGNAISKENIVGEIVIEGDSVATGYLVTRDRIQEFNQQFKTGDIGFIHRGELYVLERIKNIIIRNGQNYLSTDLENQLAYFLNLNESHIAIFEEDMASNKIVAIIEVSRAESLDDIAGMIGQEMIIDIPISKFVFVKRGSIPKTTSGKKQYYMCRRLMHQGKLKIIKEITQNGTRESV